MHIVAKQFDIIPVVRLRAARRYWKEFSLVDRARSGPSNKPVICLAIHPSRRRFSFSAWMSKTIPFPASPCLFDFLRLACAVVPVADLDVLEAKPVYRPLATLSDWADDLAEVRLCLADKGCVLVTGMAPRMDSLTDPPERSVRLEAVFFFSADI